MVGCSGERLKKESLESPRDDEDQRSGQVYLSSKRVGNASGAEHP
jgi:hypothetical protein